MKNLSARSLGAGISVLLLLLLAAAVQAAAPKDLMLVLDNSGSMHKNDPQFLARGALEYFIDKLDADSRAGVLIFDQGVRLAVPLTAIDDDSKAILIKSLDDINYRGQLTDSPAAVERAIYELKANGREGANKYMIFMTDGIVDTGDPEADVEKTKWLREELAVEAADNAIKVFAIAFTEHADFFLIQSLAKKTAGEYFRALTSADLGNVFEAVLDKLNEPPPPTVPAAMPTVSETPPVVTPFPDETVKVEPLADQASAEDLLATLTPDERQELEEISEQTGVPLEQLVLELVGPQTDIPLEAIEPGGVIITYPDEELTPEESRMGFVILAAAALFLLVLVGLVVWLLMRRHKAAPPSAKASAGAGEEPAMPQAFINDVNAYTDDRAIQLGEKPVMVGRIAGTDTQHLDYLVVNKGTVGRRHAIIKYKDYSFWIVDQGSVNGTFVNGERISGEQQLKHGDLIKFHKYEFEFSQPDMDDGFHTVFADPDLAEATIVADAATLAATSAMELQSRADAQGDFDTGGEPAPVRPATGDSYDLFDTEGGSADSGESPSAAFADSPAFADAEMFDITGETSMSGIADGDETIDDEATTVLDSPPPHKAPSGPAPVFKQVHAEPEVEDKPADEFEEDNEDISVAINLDTSAFFEEITVGPTPDGEVGAAPDVDDEGIFDIGGEAGRDDFGEVETIPPAMPKTEEGDEPDDVTLEAFMSTSMFAGTKTELTNENETVLPEHMPDDPKDKGDVNAGDTVIIDKSAAKEDNGSEDPTVLK